MVNGILCGTNSFYGIFTTFLQFLAKTERFEDTVNRHTWLLKDHLRVWHKENEKSVSKWKEKEMCSGKVSLKVFTQENATLP